MSTIKSITTIREDIIPIAGRNLEPHRVQYTEYDEKGRELKVINYDHMDEEDDFVETRYDAEGRKSAELYAQGGEVLESKYFFYDEKNRLFSERKEYLEGNADTIEVEYDDAGKMIKRRLIDDEGELETSETFEYENGLMIRQAVMDEDENLISEDLYEYNEKGQLLSLLRRNTLDEEEHHEVTVYNEQGLRAEVKQYNAIGKLVERVRYSFDEKSRVCLQEDEDVQHHTFTLYVYDDTDHIVQQVEKNMEGEVLSTITRLFDEAGQQIESEVEIAGGLYRAPQHYKVRYEKVNY
jgi:hypothetical protein